MRILVSHPTGNANVKAILYGFQKNNMLSAYLTTLAFNKLPNFFNIIPKKIRNELSRRTFDELPLGKVFIYPLREIMRLLFTKIGMNKFTDGEAAWVGIDQVYWSFDQYVAGFLNKNTNRAIDFVYAYEDGALETFKEAKKQNIICIYDLPIAYWAVGRDLMIQEASRLPVWAKTMGGGVTNSTYKLDRKTQELELADTVVVASEFVKRSLPQNLITQKKIILSPFGTPLYDLPDLTIKYKNPSKKLRVLFVGSMSQRKGLADLFAAINFLNNSNIELVVMGSLIESLEFYKKRCVNFTYESGRPHHDVLLLMRSCDIFCLPSIVEGRALVMQEAMSQGLPLIITANTGGEDLIIEGETGFLVPIQSPEAIAERINWFYENQNQIARMSIAAQRHVSNYTWELYTERIVDALKIQHGK